MKEEATSVEDRVEVPHPMWWFLVLGGLTLLAFQGFHSGFYEWWVGSVHRLPPQPYMAGLFVACIPIHAFEGIYAWRTAHRLGMSRSAFGWAVQCFVIGYPSTHLLRKRVKS